LLLPKPVLLVAHQEVSVNAQLVNMLQTTYVWHAQESVIMLMHRV
jgi:hypothetical protein